MDTRIKALRKVWRSSAEHYRAQVVRFVLILGGLLVAQAVTDISQNQPLNHGITDTRSLLSYLVPVLYVAWRQVHPSLTASQVDSAPGTVTTATIPEDEPQDWVPEPVQPAQVEDGADAGEDPASMVGPEVESDVEIP